MKKCCCKIHKSAHDPHGPCRGCFVHGDAVTTPKTPAEERLLKAALRWIFDDSGRVDYTRNSAFAKAARAVQREREKARKP